MSQVVGSSWGGDGPDWSVGDWRDTISIPTPGNVTIRWRADDFTGEGERKREKEQRGVCFRASSGNGVVSGFVVQLRMHLLVLYGGVVFCDSAIRLLNDCAVRNDGSVVTNIVVVPMRLGSFLSPPTPRGLGSA